MEATNLEATPEETEAPLERQDLFKKEIDAKNLAPSKYGCEEQRFVLRRRRRAKKRTKDTDGSRQKLSAVPK
jgi:hypothetical protein